MHERIHKTRKVRSFKSKEGGSDCTVSNDKFSSVTLNELAIKPEKAYRNFEFQQGSQSKD